jgi:hypothetical protein
VVIFPSCVSLPEGKRYHHLTWLWTRPLICIEENRVVGPFVKAPNCWIN